MRPALCAFIVNVLLHGTLTAADKPAGPFDPTSVYVDRQVEGWVVRVNKQLDMPEQRDLRDRTLKLLGDHLYRITQVVPEPALAKLRKMPVWVELAHPKHPCMCYHPSADWLRANGMNPEKARGIEIANAKNFLDWTHAQPWMVLHELAHGYHDQVLGFEHAGVRACYDAAKEAKLYEQVLHINGRRQRHYALTNPREYFAEMTEAYFGTNDFFPFVRAELKECDPRMYALLEEVWAVRSPKR